MKKLFATMMMLAMVVGIKAQQTISAQEVSDRIEIRALVDRYALESDQFKQENYSEIFHKDLKLRIHVGNNVNEINGVDNMINIYKAAGAVDISFHQTGQQLVEFADANHASGWVYLTALMVNKGNASHMYLRYFDKYEKINGRWWIVERDQYILFNE
ncbi:MAG: nuclear transport factor 2 family protein [Bacteroidaceae bacterium]|nr:nuclear transport factor 2 family protein [Bacteroidaceae bacterium]